MNILVLGGGGREHAICWAVRKSRKCRSLFCIPGNAGISEIAVCKNLDLNEKNELIKFCKKQEIDLVIIGPEQFLEDGLSDYIRSKGIPVFGPSKKASKLESSKSFAKRFLIKNKINTAKYKEFKSFNSAVHYVSVTKYPIVIKADGLAAGKGVIICRKNREAINGLDEIIKKKKFGSAGKKVIIEEYLSGFEVSYFAFFDKNGFAKLGYALDHKRAFNNDEGPNTGGMGCFSPTRKMTKKIQNQIEKKILIPTSLGLKKDKLVYRGILFFGLMITSQGPFVIEYNVRFGDPECQTLLRNLQTDILKIIDYNLKDRLSDLTIRNKKQSVVCVVVASKGYPGNYKKNKVISNLSKAQSIKGVEIFHAGTALKKEKVISSGGRVLAVTAQGNSIAHARKIAYKAVEAIGWKEGFFRNDIGQKNV